MSSLALQSTELQLVAALSALCEANRALREGASAAAAQARAARCLECLADCADLAPALRRQCDALCAQWSGAVRPPPATGGQLQVYGGNVIPLRRPCPSPPTA